MKKRKGWIVILCIFLITFCFEFVEVAEEIYSEYNSINWKEEVEIEYSSLTETEKEKYSIEEYAQMTKTRTIAFGMVMTIFMTLFLTIVKRIFIWIILIGIYLGLDKYYKKKLSKNDFMKNKEYYRDILKEYSVDILAYIDNLKLDYTNVLIAMLLQLRLKGFININNNNIYINEGVDLESLSNTEKYCIKNINNNKLVINNIYEYEELVIKEGLNKELLIEKKLTKEYFKKEFISSIVFYLIIIIGYILFWNYFPNGFNPDINNFYVIIAIFFLFMVIVFLPQLFILFYPFYLGIKFITYYIKINSNPYFRTKNAEEINKKLEGLKRFLNDFSILDERKSNEIVIWDEYLIYSVAFGQNTKIIDEYKDIILN